MRQKAMVQSICIASSRAVVAAAAAVAAPAAAAAPAVAALLLGIMRNAAKVRPQIQHVIQQKVLWGPLLPQSK